MSELTSMMNIGKEMAKKLTSIGSGLSEKFIIADCLKGRKYRESKKSYV